MNNDNIKYDYNFFENIYKNSLQKGETFSKDMGKHIQEELEKMLKQKEEWLKHKKEKQKENDTRTISKSNPNQ